jgi:Flp pilus assembly protein TadD
MNNFIQELQQRGVIRTVGLYGAVFWLLLQASDVLFPAFEIPDSVVRYLLYGGLGLLPFVVAFAWFYEITDRGIQSEAEVRESGATRLFAGSQMYFVIIGILAIALAFSVYLNLQAPAVTEKKEQPFISILIADFDNQTGDPLFDGSLEEALTIGIEGAAFINTFNRNRALGIASELTPGEGLDSERARLVAVREGINFILTGTLSQEGPEYLLTLNAVDPREGSTIAQVDASAENKLAVLQAVGSVATKLRTEFGDADINEAEILSAETFSARSLKAMQLYADAQRLAQQGQHEEAVALYREATEEDDRFGRAYSGWALSAFRLGRTEEASEIWEKTLPLLDAMTDREKFRTLGLYYTRVSRNPGRAVENYQQLVEKFPADSVGRSNLAVSYFLDRQFSKALEVGKEAADLYPDSKTTQSNFALYAMYAGDFETALQVSQALTSEPDAYFKAYLPLAVAQQAAGKSAEAITTYQQMGASGSAGQSLAYAGLIDVALAENNLPRAREWLAAGISHDQAQDLKYFLALKQLALAELELLTEDSQAATAGVDAALATSRSVSAMVQSAMLYTNLGQFEKAEDIAAELSQRLQAEERAYASFIRGLIAIKNENPITAVDTLTESLSRTDTWLARFALGQAYFHAEAYAESLSEFERCEERLGEATSIFLDDVPTYRWSTQLTSWTTRTRAELGM